MEKQLDYLAKKEEELRKLNDQLDRKKDDILQSADHISPQKEEAPEEDQYSDEEDKFEEDNADAMKGRPLKLDEQDLMGQSQKSFKSTKSKKTDRAPSEAAWSFNKPEQAEDVEDADMEQIEAYKKLHVMYGEQNKTVSF